MSVAWIGAGIAAIGLVSSNQQASKARRSGERAAGDLASANLEAARLQYKSTQEAIALQREQFNKTENNFKPWREIGKEAISRLDSGIRENAFELEKWEAPDGAELVANDPGAQFRKQQGEESIRRNAAAGGGGLASGKTMRALLEFNSGLASQEYGKAYNRAVADRGIQQGDLDSKFNKLSSLAGLGQTATSSIAQAGLNSTNNISNLLYQGATATGAGGIGAANARILQSQQSAAASQQNFNNLLGLANTGISAYKAWKT